MTRGVLSLVALGAAIIIGVVVAFISDSADGNPMTTITLSAVSNASGMVLLTMDGKRLIATVDEVDEWGRPEEPPPLITLSDDTGQAVGGFLKVAAFGEVEALAIKDDAVAFVYKTGIQTVVVRDRTEDIVLVNAPVVAELRRRAQAVAEPPYFFEFEGLDFVEETRTWELICAVVLPDARDTPASTKAVFRMEHAEDGKLLRISPAVRYPDGTIYKDYAASLHVVDGLALVGGFYRDGAVLIDWDGRVVKHIKAGARRVEGIWWDAPRKKLFMVRECVGDGYHCKEGVHFGVPLWVVDMPDGL